MNYTKITSEKNRLETIITESLDVAGKEPLFVLADRFQVHKLQILRHHYTDGRLIAFLITGNISKGEKLIVFFEFEYNIVTDYIFQKGISFDGEMAKYLGFALTQLLKEKGMYSFLPTILSKK